MHLFIFLKKHLHMQLPGQTTPAPRHPGTLVYPGTTLVYPGTPGSGRRRSASLEVRLYPPGLAVYCALLVLIFVGSLTYIDGSRSVDRINCSLVTPVSRQTQSGGF